MFTAANLARFRVVVFLMTTGDALDARRPGRLRNVDRAAAETTSASTPPPTPNTTGRSTASWWARTSRRIPAIQPATVHIEVTDHPATTGLPSAWMRTDEWYDFQTNPRPTVTVLATVDESSYTGGTMGADHPIVWTHTTTGGGRAFYTAMGHTIESYADPQFRAHVAGAIRWAAGR